MADRLARIEAVACRAPIATPVSTSFGTMRDRPAVFVRLEDDDGCFGWGEVFANWPAAGAEHRVNLLVDDVAELVLGVPSDDPASLFRNLTEKTHIRSLQCGEFGPFRQVIAGLDIAAYDLMARKRQLPVRLMLNPDAPATVPAYASGIHINTATKIVAKARADGFAAFKVKVGFASSDAGNVCTLAGSMSAAETLFADANQGFSLDNARRFLTATADAALGWLEEPIAADAPLSDWLALAEATSTPLAGGENLAGEAAFAAAIAASVPHILQPDIAKWGGFTGCLAMARNTIAAGLRYCPHFLGGGIGLAASAHLLAAAGGDGLLEADVNPNPLRDGFGPLADHITDGRFHIAEGPGLGITALPEEIASLITHQRSISL